MRDKKPSSNASSSSCCPSVVELSAHLGQRDSSIELHLTTCARCRALIRALLPPASDLAASEPSPGLPRAEVAQRAAPEGALLVGEVVALRSDRASGELLVAAIAAITESRDMALVVPILHDVDEDEDDLRLPAADPLGYEALADLGSFGWSDASAIFERLGHLPTDTMSELRQRVRGSFERPVDRALSLRRRREAERTSLFFLPTLSSLFGESWESGSIQTELEEAGWQPESLEALANDRIDRRQTTTGQVALLLQRIGWPRGMPPAANAVLRAFRCALENGELYGGQSRAAPIALLSYVSTLGRRTPTVDEFVRDVMALLED